MPLRPEGRGGGSRQQHKTPQEGDTHHADLQCLQQYSPCFLKPLCVTPKQICKLLSIQGNLRVFRPLQDRMGCLETSAKRWKWATDLKTTMQSRTGPYATVRGRTQAGQRVQLLHRQQLYIGVSTVL